MKNLDIAAGAPLAVACSGGPDSMALTLLVAEWAAKRGVTLIALIVDHGLRSNSAHEAKQAGMWLTKRDIGHHILTWRGRKPTRNIQEAAREARYRLMRDYCQAHAMEHVLLAHTLDDQAETFLLRLARGSGIDGLSAMQPKTAFMGLSLLRPLLGVRKAELLSYLKSKKQDFIRDPSNENPAFDRVKIREAMPLLTSLGLTHERLAKTAAAMARARAYLESAMQEFLATRAQFFPEGYALLSQLPEAEELALRVLAHLLMKISGHDVRPRLDDVQRLHSAVKEKSFKGATLCGCIFTLHKGAILVLREPAAVAKPIAGKNGKTVTWDNRFQISFKGSYTVGALTQQGWLLLAKRYKLKRSVPDKRILYTLPTLRDDNGVIVAIPHLKFFGNGVACDV